MVPGSHKQSDIPLNQTSARLLTRPGDLILFDQRLWHQGSQQIDTAGGDRVLVTLGFAGNNSTLTNEFERGTYPHGEVSRKAYIKSHAAYLTQIHVR